MLLQIIAEQEQFGAPVLNMELLEMIDLASMLMACGQRVGLFTSPHLIRYSERVQIDGREVAEATLLAAFERIEAVRGTTTLTFFEYNTLAALDAFRHADVSVMVLEVGLGGRLDATNIVDADVAVLCSVGLDRSASNASLPRPCDTRPVHCRPDRSCVRWAATA